MPYVCKYRHSVVKSIVSGIAKILQYALFFEKYDEIAVFFAVPYRLPSLYNLFDLVELVEGFERGKVVDIDA